MAPKSPSDEDKMVPCTFCLGVSVYTKAMWEVRAPPDCKGIELRAEVSTEYMDEIKSRTDPPRGDTFTFLGLGVSVYSKDWMKEGNHMPAVKGLGVLAVSTEESEDDLEDMETRLKRIEERKRIQREIERELADELDAAEDDEDGGLMERDPIPSVMPPRMPTPILPTISIEDLMNRSMEHAKASTIAMYRFWERRLEGFGSRYVESCRRIGQQMEKQVRTIPRSSMWLVHQIQDQIRGGKGGDNGVGRV